MEFSDRILFADDDPQIRVAFARSLRGRGFGVDVAKDAGEAIELAKDTTYGVVAVDYRMPGLNGFELREELRELQPDASYVLISGNCDLDLTLDAINEYEMSYVIPKPWSVEELISTLNRALEESWERASSRKVAANMVHANRDVERRRGEIDEADRKLRRSVIDSLHRVMQARHGPTAAHCERAMAYSLLLSNAMGVSGLELERLSIAAKLHDLGKIAVPDAILNKSGPLSDEEWVIIRSHPEAGATVLEPYEWMDDIRTIILHHHERWDGAGYPGGISGNGIRKEARILAIADSLDAMTSDRPYRKALSFKSARREIMSCSGTQFDPAVVRVFGSLDEDRFKEAREQAHAGAALAA